MTHPPTQRDRGYGQPPPHFAGAEAPKGKRRWLIPTLAAVGGLIVGSAAAGGSNARTVGAPVTVTVTERPGPGAVVTQTVTATAVQVAAKPAAAVSFSGDGTYMVGTDVKAGTYRSTKPDSNCYWARLNDTSGGFNSIIANGNSAGQVTVTIKRTDVAFQASGCADWVRVK